MSFKLMLSFIIWEASFQIIKHTNTPPKNSCFRNLKGKFFFSFSSLNYSGQCFDFPFPLGHEDCCLWDLGYSHCNNCKQSALEMLNADVTKSPVAQTSVNASEHYKIKKQDSRFMMLFFLKALILPAKGRETEGRRGERERERGRNRTQKG